MRDRLKINDQATAHDGGRWVADELKLEGTWTFTARNPDGSIAWEVIEKNLVVNVGLDDILEQYFNGAAYTASHFVGLTDGTPTVAATDTMASHPGWTEITAYSEANRPAYTPAAASGQSITNGAARASYSINGSTTVGGAFLTTDNTKGGTAGTLFAAVALTGGDQALSDGQTLEVTYIVNAAG